MSWFGDFIGTVSRVGAGVFTLGGSELVMKGLDAINPQAPLINKNGDALSDADQALLGRIVDPARKSQMLMNWLVGPAPKPVNPGENFANAERMAGVVAKADAGKGMSGLFGMGLLVGDTAPNLNLPVGQPGQEPSAGPIIDLTPQTPTGAPTNGGGNTGQPGTGPMGPTQNIPNRGPGDVYPGIGIKR